MNKQEEAFLRDFSALLKKHKVDFYSWDQYGGDDCFVSNAYVFEDYKDFHISIDEVLEFLHEEEKVKRREERQIIREKAREERRREK